MTAGGLLLQVLKETGLRGQKAPAALASPPRTEGGNPHGSSSGQHSSVVPALQPLQLILEPHIEPWHVSRTADIGNVQAVDPATDLLAATHPAHSAQGSSADSATSEVTTALQTASSHQGQGGAMGCATPATPASATAGTAIGGAAADAPEHASEQQDAAHVSPAVQSPPNADWAPGDAVKSMQQEDAAAEDGLKAGDIMQDHTEQQLTRAPESGSKQPQPSWAAHATDSQPPNLASEAEGADGMASGEMPAAWQEQLLDQHQQRESWADTITGGASDQDVQHENQETGAPTSRGSFADAHGRRGGSAPTAAASAPPHNAMPWAEGMNPGAAKLPDTTDPTAAIAHQESGQAAAALAKALGDGATDAERPQPDNSAFEQQLQTHHSLASWQADALAPWAPQVTDTGAHSWQLQPVLQSSGPDAGAEWQQEAKDVQHATAAGSAAMESDSSSLPAPRQQLEVGAAGAAAEQRAQRRSLLDHFHQEEQHADQLQQRAGLTSDSRFEPQPAAGQLDAQRQPSPLAPFDQHQQVEDYSLPQRSDAEPQHTSQLPMHAQALASPHAEPPAAAVQPSDGAAPAPALHTDWAALDAASAGRATSPGSLCSSADSGSVASSRPDASDAEPAQVSTGM
jgi:hypothetical protein